MKRKSYYDIVITNKGFKDINPVLCGSEKCGPLHSFGPHVRQYYLIHYVKSGKGVFTRGCEHYAVGENQMFIIKPGEVTTYTADKDDPWEYIWVGFDGKAAERFSELSPVVELQTNLFSEMLECDELKSCREEFLASKLFMLYSLLFEDGNTVNDYVKQARDYINANYVNSIYINDIARLIGVERTYLSRIFKERMGISMQSYLINVRLKHAADLLHLGYGVGQAAAMCGYSDCFNFSKMFKKRYGVSPNKYKP